MCTRHGTHITNEARYAAAYVLGNCYTYKTSQNKSQMKHDMMQHMCWRNCHVFKKSQNKLQMKHDMLKHLCWRYECRRMQTKTQMTHDKTHMRTCAVNIHIQSPTRNIHPHPHPHPTIHPHTSRDRTHTPSNPHPICHPHGIQATYI